MLELALTKLDWRSKVPEMEIFSFFVDSLFERLAGLVDVVQTVYVFEQLTFLLILQKN